MDAGPILILASGQRCGSTLVQRLLSSHPEILIWGEHGGQIQKVLEATRIVRWWCDELSGPAREAFDAGGHQSWIANLMPEPSKADDAARAFIDTLFARPAADRGYRHWGFKEVRLTLQDAEEMRILYPGTRVIHLTRDPRALLRSLDNWEREGGWKRSETRDAVDFWRDVNRSFLGADGDWLQSWRFEDVVADPDRFIAAVAPLVGVDAGALDRSVFDRRIESYSTEDRRKLRDYGELPPDMRALVESDELRGLAREYGYGW